MTHSHGKERTVVVLREVGNERYRQEQLKMEGRFRFTCSDLEMPEPEKLAVLMEEVGEAARALLEKLRLANDVHGKDLKKELIQVAAVAVAWAESL
jgi:NTP pyrophosphatase (non-canonical NTP hydrolase)